MDVRYINHVREVKELSSEEIAKLEPVEDRFAFRTNSYYNSLINWDDPNDPIKRLIIPEATELLDWGELDVSDEKHYQPIPGIEHKYRDTALLLCNDVCAAYCRFCFRKRLFQSDNDEVVREFSEGIEYIRSRPEINNVLLTGGDPLVMSTGKLEKIIEKLSEIDHLRVIRIGTKMPAFNPYRITKDPSLQEMLQRYGQKKQIFVMVHFNCPVELTDVAIQSLKMLVSTGATVVNQTPLIRGVNDSPGVLSSLLAKLTYIGIVPYYIFACRPTQGNKSYAIPVETAYEIYRMAMESNSGLAKIPRFIMSHKVGKIEVVGMTPKLIFLKCHNIVDHKLNGSFMVYKRNAEAYWFDDYEGLQVDMDMLFSQSALQDL